MLTLRQAEGLLWDLRERVISIEPEGESPTILRVECASVSSADLTCTLLELWGGLVVRRTGPYTFLMWEDD